MAGGFSARLVARLPSAVLAAGPADDDGRRAADHGGAGKDGVRCSSGIFGAGGRIAGQLLCGVGLAREEGLIDEEIAAFDKARVCGHEIAGDQLDNVARNQLVDRQRDALAVAPYGRLDRYRPAQCFHGILSADFLDEIQRDAGGDDGHHDEEARDVAGRRGQPARHEQDDHQRVAEPGEELQPEWRALDGGRVIGSIGREPRLRLRHGEARRSCRELCEKLGERFLPDFLGSKFVLCGGGPGCGYRFRHNIHWLSSLRGPLRSQPTSDWHYHLMVGTRKEYPDCQSTRTIGKTCSPPSSIKFRGVLAITSCQ